MATIAASVQAPIQMWSRWPYPPSGPQPTTARGRRLTICSSMSYLGYAVFHLPRVVQRVPRGASRGVRHRPLLLAVGIAQARAQRCAKPFDRAGVVPGGLLLAQADPLRVLDLGAEHVLEHLVAIAAAAARSFGE